MDYKDYYSILDVSKSASQDEIKKAYRKLAAKHHPDVHGGDEKASKRFTEIGEAYEVLKDPEKRKLYNKVGKDWKQYQQAGIDPDEAGAFGGYGGFRNGGQHGRSYQYSSQAGNPFGETGFSDFFESLFGGRAAGAGPFGPGAGARQSRRPAGRDVTASLSITLEEAITGSSRAVKVGEEQMNVKIPAGITDGKKLKLKGRGYPGPDGSTRGDLLLSVNILPHERYQLRDGKLYVDHPVDAHILMLGGQTTVQAPDKQVRINIASGTQNGKVFRLPGLGFPEFRKPDKRGPLYVKVSAHIPQNLSEKQKKLLREAFEE